MGSNPIHPVSPIDQNHLLYGNFIGLQYAFAQSLNSEILNQAIWVLTDRFPALTGRYTAKSESIKIKNHDVSLEVQQTKGSIEDVLTALERPNYIAEPMRRDVLQGRAPLSTFTLTEFEGGGTILGVAISHLLTDAAGYHLLLAHLGEIYTHLKKSKTPPSFPLHTQLDEFDFGTDRSKAEVLKSLEHRNLPKPIPIKGLMGKAVKSLIIKAMDKSLSENIPVLIKLTTDNITRLKTTVLTESGEDWISTNMALCAHFTALIAKLSYRDEITADMQIGQLLDLRNRYFEDISNTQSQFVGNAILIHIDKASFPDGLQNTSRGALAQYFKNRQSRTDASDVKTRLNLLSDCLRHGYTNPELDVKNPIISLNNQSKMNIYDIAFDEQIPKRIYPQDVGDNIMFFPASDGGVEIYIRDIVNPQGQRKLLLPEWQARIFDF